jgi:hypothetical protein
VSSTSPQKATTAAGTPRPFQHPGKCRQKKYRGCANKKRPEIRSPCRNKKTANRPPQSGLVQRTSSAVAALAELNTVC